VGEPFLQERFPQSPFPRTLGLGSARVLEKGCGEKSAVRRTRSSSPGLHSLETGAALFAFFEEPLKLGATGEGLVRAVAAGWDANDPDADDFGGIEADDEFLALLPRWFLATVTGPRSPLASQPDNDTSKGTGAGFIAASSPTLSADPQPEIPVREGHQRLQRPLKRQG